MTVNVSASVFNVRVTKNAETVTVSPNLHTVVSTPTVHVVNVSVATITTSPSFLNIDVSNFATISKIKIHAGSDGKLKFYASNGTTLIAELDESGNFGLLGRVYSL